MFQQGQEVAGSCSLGQKWFVFTTGYKEDAGGETAMLRGAISRAQVESESLKGEVAISALSGSENTARALSP